MTERFVRRPPNVSWSILCINLCLIDCLITSHFRCSFSIIRYCVMFVNVCLCQLFHLYSILFHITNNGFLSIKQLRQHQSNYLLQNKTISDHDRSSLTGWRHSQELVLGCVCSLRVSVSLKIANCWIKVTALSFSLCVSDTNKWHTLQLCVLCTDHRRSQGVQWMHLHPQGGENNFRRNLQGKFASASPAHQVHPQGE